MCLEFLSFGSSHLLTKVVPSAAIELHVSKPLDVEQLFAIHQRQGMMAGAGWVLIVEVLNTIIN